MKIEIIDFTVSEPRNQQSVLAEFTVVFDDELEVRGFKLEREGERVFVTMPLHESGKVHQHLFQPLSEDLLDRIFRTALNAYHQHREKCHNNGV